MRRSSILLLILAVSALYAHAQDKTIEGKRKDTAKELVKTKNEIRNDSIKAAYESLNDSVNIALFQKIAIDHTMTNDMSGESNIQILESSDKKIRIIEWVGKTLEHTKRYYHVVQYYIAPDRTRTFSDYENHNETVFSEANTYNPMKIKAIHTIRHGIYTIEAYTETQQKLYAIDISRGIMNDAYIFRNEEDNPISYIEQSNNEPYEIDGQNLIKSDETKLRFNGSHYEDEELYLSRFDNPEIGNIPYITSMYFKRVEDGKPTTSTYPGEEVILTLDVAYRDNILNDSIYAVTINTTEDNEHYEAKRVKVSMPLRSLNNRIFVEAFNFYYLPVDSISDDVPLTKILNTAGRSTALTYQWLRYSALAFNRRNVNEDDYKRIRWTVEVNGKKETLDSTQYWGTQIDIQMKEEWANQTIIVTPYIEACAINKEVGIKTKVTEQYKE